MPASMAASKGVTLAAGLPKYFRAAGVDTIGSGAEINPVQIERQDLLLGEGVFQPERQQQFLTLAPNGAVGRKENILGQLLGDGAAALNQAAGTDIGDDGAHQALGIDAEMAVEAAVFRRQQGIGQIGGQFVEIDLLAVEVPIARQNLPIGRD